MEKIIKELFEKFNYNYQAIKSSLSKNLDIKEKIEAFTNFLPKSSNFSQRLFHLINDFDLIPHCACGKETTFLGFTKGYSDFCGRVCARKSNMLMAQKVSNTEEVKNKRKENNLKKYGVENPFQILEIKNKIKENKDLIDKKRKKTNLERYGIEYVAQSKEIRTRIEDTNIEKYGVKSLLLIPEIRSLGEEKLNSEETKNKRKQTNLAKTPLQKEEIQNKTRKTNIKKYGVEFPFAPTINSNFDNLFGIIGKFNSIVKPLFLKEDYFGGNRKIKYLFKCLKCYCSFEDHTDDGHIPRCLICYPYEKMNYFEDDFFSWLKQLNLKIYRRDKTQIKPLEIDFYFPDLKIGIEFNELRSHSERGNQKGNNYHLNKTERCLEKNIQLIHIFQDEWLFKQNIVKSIILTKFGLLKNKIYARNTEFREIIKEEGSLFFKINHLQGAEGHIKKYFGLYFNNKLVQLIGIGKSRYNKNYDYELIRSCTLLNTIVVGGFDKLIKNLPLQGNIISYVDRRYFNGNSYKDWDFVGKTQSNYYYCDKKYQQRISRLKFQKHKLNHHRKDLTEWEIMQLAGYDRIWDCGNLVYSITI